MPIDYSNYPSNWKEISHHIRFVRAKGKCEGTKQFPHCKAVHGQPHPDTGSKVVLTVAHLNHNTQDNRPQNLRALCQRCHNNWDIPYRNKNKANRKIREQVEAGQLELFTL